MVKIDGDSIDQNNVYNKLKMRDENLASFVDIIKTKSNILVIKFLKKA